MKEYKWQIAVILLAVSVMSVFISQKEGYHMDEVLSFEFANAEYTPWIVPWQPEGRFATFVYNEIETGDFWETVGNWIKYTLDYWINGEDSIAYNYEGKVYVQSVWISREEFKEFVTTGPKDRFNLVSVYYNEIRDSHPPLFYMCLHLVCSVFSGIMSPWLGALVNLTAMVICCIFLIKIGILLTGEKRAGTLAILLYCLSTGGIGTVVLIRMYCMLTCFCVISLYFHLKKWQSGDWRVGNKLLIFMTVCGFWTQYYFIFFAIFMAGVTVLGLLFTKRGKQALYYIRSMVIAAAIGLCTFPYAVSDVLEGSTGRDVVSNLLGGSGEWAERMKSFGGMLCGGICGKSLGMALLVLLIVIAAVICLTVKEKRKELTKDRIVQGAMVVLPAACYFLVTALISPFYADRYIMPTYAFLALLFAVVLEWYVRYLSQWIGSKQGLRAIPVLLAGVLGIISVASYGNSYLYVGYSDQLEMAKKYADYPCLCIYDGVTFYENVPEFAIYEETLVLTCCELEERCQFDLLVDREDVVVLIKRNVDEEWVHQMMQNKYGYNNYELIFTDNIYGEKIFFYSHQEETV